MKSGIELIAQERKEQIEKHRRSVEQDMVENTECQLAYGAQKLITPSTDVADYLPPDDWDEAIWEKMISKDYIDRLIIAGALIAAEIDRLNESKKYFH